MKYIFITILALSFSGCFSEKNSQTETRKLVESSEEERKMTLKKAKVEDIPEYAKLSTESRYALVIGNNNYQKFTTLKNAENDARDIGNKLEKLGFKVFRVFNGNKDEMNLKIRQFSNLLKKSGGVGMLFYAGHGLEMAGKNYLVPTDSNVKSKFDIPDENVALNTVIARLDEAKNRLNIVVLDACRNDPVADGDIRAGFITQGLTNPPKAKGTYIAYSADVGELAKDGDGKNGVFTKHLLANLDKEGIPLNKIFQETRKAVERETNGEQSPASYDKTTGDFYFVLPKEKTVSIGENSESESVISLQDGEITEFKLTLNTSPIDAKVNLESGKYYKKGNYKITVSKEGFYSKTVNLDLVEDTTLNVTLQKSHFNLILNTYPKDSKVQFKNINFTNGMNLKKGKYSFTVSKDGYRSKSGEIDLQKDTILNIELLSNTEKEAIKESELVWNGKGKALPYLGKSFQEALENGLNYYLTQYGFPNEEATYPKHLKPQGEFETKVEFEHRKEKFNEEKKAYLFKYKKDRKAKIVEIKKDLQNWREEIFNSWLGTQNISMRYNPEKAQFSVEEKSFGFKFDFPVSRSEARDFKKNTKNFDFIFEERGKNLYIVGAKSGNFSTNLNIKITPKQIRERARAREIKENSVVVGNLMFQDKNLPQRMRLYSAVSYCEDLNLFGFSDWRLPNIEELKIAQNNKNSFRNLQSKTSYYWSISEYNYYNFWVVNFDDGDDYWLDRKSRDFAVCVRDL
jgi:hypothetical protein